MSQLDDLWREIMGRDLEAESTIAAAYGIDPETTYSGIRFENWHYSSKASGVSPMPDALTPRVRAAFNALCADEIVVEEHQRHEYFVQFPMPVVWDPRPFYFAGPVI